MRIKSCRWLFVLLAMSMMVCGYAQQIKTVTGSVSDEKGIPIEGVSIRITNGKALGMTDAAGGFSVKVGSSVNSLTFSSVGYAEKNAAINGGFLKITMTAKSDSADEVVVTTSFGIKKQARSLGYAVSTISAKQLTESGATNIGSALYGKAAGVKIVTPPGGASSAVSVQIRGVSSIGLNTQPLYVVDGVPIRLYNDLSGNLGSGSNNGGYWSNQRVQGNGVLDINPEDIASMTILKGASASALYGSEATNGVVIITTKKGSKGRGLGVDFNYLYDQERVAYTPKYQNEYGPGDGTIWGPQYDGTDANGWVTDADGAQHPYYGTSAQFGPKFDGRDVEYYDGTTRAYSPYKNNWRDFYQTGYNSNANVAISNATDKGNYRFSYTRMDYKSIMAGSDLNKNNFNFNGTLKLSKKVSVDVISSYNYNFTHNRPYLMGQIFGSYSGFLSRFDDINTLKSKYKTTDGYKYVTSTNSLYDQDQKFVYPFNATNVLDYFWNTLTNTNNETQNRFINSVTLNAEITDELKFRARVGGDFTSLNIIDEQHNTQPSYLGATGQYDVTNSTYNIFYGDALLTYSHKVNKDFNFNLSGGVTGRKQVYKYQYSSTSNGLVSENFFSLNNSYGALSTIALQPEQQNDVAAFSTLDMNYKDLIYLEGTGRYEATSTLPSANNNYFYPSVNGSFILSDAVKLPRFFNYAKVRASYGLVGNHPNIYQSNVAYYQTGVLYNSEQALYQSSFASGYGNNQLKSEKKREMEFGLETRFLHNRIGLDVSYYNNKVSNQILTLSTAPSVGSSSQVMNAGSLSNYGLEAAINATAITTRDFSWNVGFNFAINRNKLTALPTGFDNLQLSSQDGGYAVIRAKVGDPLGNIYVHPIETDANGNNVINSSGFYTINTNDYKKVGNIMPKYVGGLTNSFKYKRFSLDVTIDYRLGGDLLSIPTYYQIGMGMYESTLQYRDAAHGGLSYNIDANNNIVAAQGGAYHDGVVLKGVTASGAQNTTMVDASRYYQYTYNWETTGAYQNAVFKNSYIKLREVTLSYNLPKELATKLHFQNLQFALVSRNLFYIWKTLPYGLDPEVAVGSSWLSQGIDGGAGAPTRSIGVSLRAAF